MASSTLEALEARFADLQRKMLGASQTVDAYDRSSPPVADLLLEATGLITTALSGREKVNAMTPRMGELEEYLDPTFEDEGEGVGEAALSAGPALERRCEQLGRLADMAPVLDSREMAEVGSHADRVGRLLAAGVEAGGAADEGCARAYRLVEEYNAVVVNITRTLVHWDDLVTQLELQSRPKKVVE